MVFKNPITLARSVISKTFPQGYAQSLVAATQSSSASHNTHLSTHNANLGYFGKTSSGPQPSNHGAPSAVGGAANTKPDTANTATERGLDAYYAAWQKHHRAEDKEHQFQFAKRIGWRAPTTIPEAQVQNKSIPPARPAHRREASRPSYIRARSASAVDDINTTSHAASARPNDVALLLEEVTNENAKVEVASATEEVSTSVEVAVDNVFDAPVAATGKVSASPSNADILSPALSTGATSVSEVDPYTNQLTTLAEADRHAESPAVFEAMLRDGVKPTSTAYNALLLAAIHIPRGKHQVIPKVLDVYSDMLRRHVAPDTTTYAILIEVLAARALDVSAMKNDLVQKQARYSPATKTGSFLFASDEAEFRILTEDDSLGLAITLFDTSAALTTNHAFPADTYRFLISACAEQSRINDMVRIYAEMESQQIVPPTSIFPPMIRAFASTGDLRSSVECYEEYKSLAVSHDMGVKSIDRRDDAVYAALVNAYAICDQMNSGLKFLGRLEEAIQDSQQITAIRNAVALQALVPEWTAQQAYSTALSHISRNLSGEARDQALVAVCVDAADKNNMASASEALSLLQTQFSSSATMSTAAAAVLAAHIRNRDLESAEKIWRLVATLPHNANLLEPLTMHVIAHFGSSNITVVLSEARQMISSIRSSTMDGPASIDVLERIDEAINVIARRFLELTPVPSAPISVELLQTMLENDAVSTTLVEHLLAPLGPNEVANVSNPAVSNILMIQAGLLIDRPHLDVGHTARLSHLVDLVGARNIQLDRKAWRVLEQAAVAIGRSDLISRAQGYQQPVATPISPYMAVYSPPTSLASPEFEDTFDPYAAATDFKGSNIIAEELEKTYGRHVAHLSEALVKFKNMRRAGRHPRYVTYAKLISAAAKENRMSLAQDILAMAKQDVPFLPQSRVVAQGWIAILDSMVSACLTMGNRESASHYHHELLSMGFAPSANTFGLYITTLKEGAKTFDEATEAVKIFHQAKRENVEPTSFLYNALIGKLGKARRIDDCLFYFAEMRQLGIRPTSVTYGTIVNALCRVSDDKFAEELFEEMESMPNYKPRPAPYNSLMQYFLTTKRDRSKVLAYYERMRSSNIEPTMHTYKLLIDTHATLEPVDMRAAEFVLADIKLRGMQPEAVHYSALIHAKGCVLHDLPASRATFDQVISEGYVQPCPSLYQAIFESMVANHDIAGTDALLTQMSQQGVRLTPYIANTLIHGWALVKDISKARSVYDSLGMEKREPSTYEAMTRAYLAIEDRGNAKAVVGEALRRGYPAAVAGKICDLIGSA